MLLGAESAVVDVGRARRVVSASTRRALNARDRQCRRPGCDRPASWSAATTWCTGSAAETTNLSNLILLCHRHHWTVHEGRWKLASAGDQLVTIPPATDLFPAARGPDFAAA